MNGKSDYNMTIVNSSSELIIQFLFYQGNDVGAGPIYNEYNDVDDTLKFDIYENGDIVTSK